MRIASLLVILHCVALMVQAIVGSSSFLELSFRDAGAGQGYLLPEFWKWGTWFLANPPRFWFLIDMAMLWVFGRELENVMGRKFLARLYLAMIALPAVMALCALLLGIGDEVSLSGPSSIHFSIFMAVAFLHPDAPSFFGVKLKFLAGALISIFCLQYLYLRNGFAAAVLLSSTALTYFIMRRWGLTPRFERVTEAISAAMPRRLTPKQKALPYTPKVRPKPEISPDPAPVAKIDAILEKISRAGIDSLDEWERRELERASKELKRLDQ